MWTPGQARFSSCSTGAAKAVAASARRAVLASIFAKFESKRLESEE